MEELTDQQHDDLAAYLSDQMTPGEKTAFEEQLRQNEALQQELKVQQRVRRGMRLLSFEQQAAAFYAKAKEELATEKTAQPAEVTVRPLWQRPAVWLAAASVLLTLGLFWRFYKTNGLNGPETPIAQKDTTVTQPRPADTVRSSPPPPTPAPPADPGLLLADALFKPTPKAAPLPIEPPDETDAAGMADTAAVAQDSLAVWQGARLLQQRQLREAIPVLQKTVLEGYPGHWRACAEWYLSLAYLRNRQRREARSILTRIARTDGHPYQEEARKLRSRLNE